MNNNYFLFQIGPVQEFLAASRKTKDLYGGSLLLSELSSVAIKNITDNGGTVIYPVISASNQGVPNHIFGKTDKVEILDKTKGKVIEEFNLAASETKKIFNISDNIWDSLWEEQINKFLEVYWVIYTPSNGEDYGEIFRKLNSALSQRKLLRNFDELNYDNTIGQPLIKCSLIPYLSALHTNKEAKHSEVKSFWKDFARKNPSIFKESEKLSAVAVTKRNFSDYKKSDGSFPSTTTIASGNFYREIISKAEIFPLLLSTVIDYKEKVIVFQNSLKQYKISNFPSLEAVAKKNYKPIYDFLHTDGDWLFEESYSEKRLEKEYGIYDKLKLENAKNARKDIFKIIQEFNRLKPDNYIENPSKYYAVIYLDGDEMGKWLSGDIKNDKKENFYIDEEVHKKMSMQLNDFANVQVKDILENELDLRLGKIIYAGGDDLIAFCALEDLFIILERLQNSFTNIMGEATNNFKPATCSIGVCIAHHLTNLQQVLEGMREAGKYAKDKLNRDSFAINLIKRSGEHSITGVKWFNETHSSASVTVLREFADKVKQNKVSTNFVYSLAEERLALRELELEELDEYSSPNLESIKKRISFVFLKHTSANEVVKKENKEYLNNSLLPFYEKLNDIDVEGKKPFKTYEQFLNLLEAAQFIALRGKV